MSLPKLKGVYGVSGNTTQQMEQFKHLREVFANLPTGKL